MYLYMYVHLHTFSGNDSRCAQKTRSQGCWYILGNFKSFWRKIFRITSHKISTCIWSQLNILWMELNTKCEFRWRHFDDIQSQCASLAGQWRRSNSYTATCLRRVLPSLAGTQATLMGGCYMIQTVNQNIKKFCSSLQKILHVLRHSKRTILIFRMLFYVTKI